MISRVQRKNVSITLALMGCKINPRIEWIKHTCDVQEKKKRQKCSNILTESFRFQSTRDDFYYFQYFAYSSAEFYGSMFNLKLGGFI